jgi:prolyl-tRNA editing enzyme YbaK/EbsC (Cys-tRNA(Pro) deacylase)
MGFSTSSVSKALSLNPEIAVKSLGQMKAGGIAPLSQENRYFAYYEGRAHSRGNEEGVQAV